VVCDQRNRCSDRLGRLKPWESISRVCRRLRGYARQRPAEAMPRDRVLLSCSGSELPTAGSSTCSEAVPSLVLRSMSPGVLCCCLAFISRTKSSAVRRCLLMVSPHREVRSYGKVPLEYCGALNARSIALMACRFPPPWWIRGRSVAQRCARNATRLHAPSHAPHERPPPRPAALVDRGIGRPPANSSGVNGNVGRLGSKFGVMT